MTIPQQPAAAASDKTQLWGILGIVIGLICCGPAGIVFGILSLQEAKKSGKPPTLGYVAIGASVVGMIWNIAVTINRLS